MLFVWSVSCLCNIANNNAGSCSLNVELLIIGSCDWQYSWQYSHDTLLMTFCLGPMQFACPGPRRWLDQTESKLWNKFAINLHTAHQHALLLAMTKEDQACAMRLFMFVASLLSISASNVYCCGQNKNYHNVNFCSLLSWGPRHDSWLDAFHSWV